ncbi:MAG: glycosyltransferase, partial [Flavobacteriales bacterium]
MPAAKKTLNIALVGPAHPLRGGIADFNEALARSLQAAGHRVRIHSFSLQYPSILFPGKSQLTDSPVPEGLDIASTINSIGPRSWYTTANAIISSRPDLVIIRYWLPFMAPALGTIARRVRKKGIPVIAITDNVIPHEHRTGDKLFTGFFIRSCDGFVAMSRSVLDDLAKFTAVEHRIFQPHPVYDIFGESVSKTVARKRLSMPDDQPMLLFFGFIRPYKGLKLLLEAMTDERIRRRNIQLIVAGEFYENQQPFLDYVKAHGMEDVVRFDADFIPKSEVATYFCAADMVVQPYISATQSGIT